MVTSPPSSLSRSQQPSSGNSSKLPSRKLQARRKRSVGGKGSIGLAAIQGVLIVGVFLSLLQIYDPFAEEPIHITHQLGGGGEHDSSPVHEGLKDFTMGRKVLSEQQQQVNQTALEVAGQGREKILELLEEAGVREDLTTVTQILELPTWKSVSDLYGDEHVVQGMQSCPEYRAKVPKNKRILAVAGLFNTGTNALERHLHKNIMAQGLWQTPWGKHRMAEVKWNHTAGKSMEKYDKNHVLPIVMIRDPYAWMQSMCAHPYSAKWRHDKHHCPNLVPNDEDRKKYNHLHDVFMALIKFDSESTYSFKSLVDMWNTWYLQYLRADYPVLIIRFEDMIFQPHAVLQDLADCVESELAKPLNFFLKTSKAHGSGTDYIHALVKTADASLRRRNLTNDDLRYAAEHLDAELMNLFHYHVLRAEEEEENGPVIEKAS